MPSDCGNNTYCSVYTNTCIADSCQDGRVDGNETDVDCGRMCPNNLCGINRVCLYYTDCASGDCYSGVCTTPPAEGMCIDHYNEGKRTDGAYIVFDGKRHITVRCDMANGGWMEAYARSSWTWDYATGYYFYTSQAGTYFTNSSDEMVNETPEAMSQSPAPHSWYYSGSWLDLRIAQRNNGFTVPWNTMRIRTY